MILAAIKEPGAERADLYTLPGDWTEYLAATFNPDAQRISAANTRLSGKDRTSWRWQAEAILHDLEDLAFCEQWSYSELATIQEAARNVAKRAGIIREARAAGCIIL